MYCDLHTHSVYSDGTAMPSQIIAEAKAQGLAAVALTDHNTAAGLPEFLEEAKKQGVTAIGGTELSTEHKGTEFHLLGLMIEPEHYAAVERLAKEFFVLKEISNMEMIERLNEAGYEITYAEVRRQNPTGNVNRAHVAAVLLEKGYVSSVQHAFKTVLRDGSGFYIPPARLQLIDAIRFLRSIHAVPVLAHPLKDTEEATLRALMPEAIEAGLLGMETLHSAYDASMAEAAAAVARDFGLLQTGGSDFHGENKPDIPLGLCRVPAAFYEELCRAL